MLSHWTVIVFAIEKKNINISEWVKCWDSIVLKSRFYLKRNMDFASLYDVLVETFYASSFNLDLELMLCSRETVEVEFIRLFP